MSEWHIARNGQQEGPFTPQQVGAMLASGELKAGDALAWKEGMADWKPIPESGVLAEASLAQTGTTGGGVPTPSAVANPSPVPSQAAQPIQQPAQQAAVNPYAAPTAGGGLAVGYQNRLEYPGIGRLAYVGLQFGITIAAYAILFVVILGAGAMDSGGGILGGAMLVMLLAVAAGIYIGVKRVQNLGMSGWAILWSLVPIMSIWISWRMFACPAGYDDHKQLDTPGKVLTGIMIALFALYLVGLFVALLTGGGSNY